MLEELGPDLEVRKITKYYELECPFILLEKIWMWNLQTDVSLHF